MASTPRTRQEFKDNCMETLGFPVIQIEIADAQIENCIDAALRYFYDYHWNGTQKVYYKHQLTDDDMTNRYIEIPDSISDVVSVFRTDTFGMGDTLFNIQYQFALNDLYPLTSASIVPYFIARNHLALIAEFFGQAPQLRFNRVSDKVYVDTNWSTLSTGRYLVFECYQQMDPAIYPDVWKERWLMEYATALMQEQVGRHLSKMNLTNVGNVTFNGREMYNDARDRIKELRDELVLSPPVIMPQIG